MADGSNWDVDLRHYVATVELKRGPNNFIDAGLIAELADIGQHLGDSEDCRAILLCSDGKHFCAGADLARRLATSEAVAPSRHVYHEARRLWDIKVPLVAAIQGAAVGAGLGLALVADFRVATERSRFSANFVSQGLHPGFGLTATLPFVIGNQKASWMMYSGVRVTGRDALSMGLVDAIADESSVREMAFELARRIGEAAPLALAATRMTLRADLKEAFIAATHREFFEQNWLRNTDDYREGVTAMNGRTTPNFQGK